MRLAHADQHIAAIPRGKDHDVGAPAQNFRGLAQVIGAQRGTIGADDQGGRVRRRNRREHPRAQISVALTREPNSQT